MGADRETTVLIRKSVHVLMGKDLKTAVCAKSIHANCFTQFLKNLKNYVLMPDMSAYLKKWIRYIKLFCVSSRTWIGFILIEIKPIKKEKLPTCHSSRLAEARGSAATPVCDGVGSPGGGCP